RRPRRQGAEAAGRDRRASHRLRLVQSDDTRLRREGAARAVGLRAAPRAAGRHVPPHAARRVRRAPAAAARMTALAAFVVFATARGVYVTPDAGLHARRVATVPQETVVDDVAWIGRRHLWYVRWSIPTVRARLY